MGISETKKQIVIDNYFKKECDVNTSIKEAFTKGFELGLKKNLMPQPKAGHWIPVSERLPADAESVLVYAERNAYDDKGKFKKKVIDIGWQVEGGWHIDGCNGVDGIAWMPLPEPYEPQERSNE